MISFAISESTIVLAYDGKSFRINRKVLEGEDYVETNASKNIIAAIRAKQLDSATSPIPKIVDISESFKGSPFFISNGSVYIDGVEAPSVITKKILEYKEEGIPYDSIVAFHRNVMKNPSKDAQNELFLFLEHNGHPFTEEGYFLAYKRVRTDFYSIYGYSEGSPNNVLNAPQTWVTMDRTKVNSNRNQTCSSGLHAANYQYAAKEYCSGEGLLIELIIDPKDVVSIPSDYKNMKMRVCRYFVVGPCAGESTKVLIKDWEVKVDNNAPTNNVNEGDFEEETIADALVEAVNEPEVEPTAPETRYYQEYVNAKGIVWKYVSSTDTHLEYGEVVGFDGSKHTIRIHTRILKGEKVPVTWIPNLSLGFVKGLWPIKKVVSPVFNPEPKHIVKDGSFGDLAKSFIAGGVIKPVMSPKFDGVNPKAVVTKKATPEVAPIFTPKVDTKLNYLTQPRIGGKFVKKNP